jgi:DNA-binding MarR family transcriptional regulator
MGLVQRERGSSGDERIVTVSLTPEGQQRLMAWREARRGYLIGLLAALDAEELAVLQPLLLRLVAAAEREDGGDDATG